MKVIRELVDWFDRRGLLGEADMAALNEQGLLAQDAPRTMLEHCGRVGRTWCFRVVGDTEGPVWGTDVYTGDSSVAASARIGRMRGASASPGSAIAHPISAFSARRASAASRSCRRRKAW